MKRNQKKQTRKPKPQRDSLQKRIARAKTHDEKIRLAVFGQAHLPDGLEYLVKQWRTVRLNRAAKGSLSPENREAFHAFVKDAERDILHFAISVMVHNQPDMLIALAQEMKRQDQPEHTPAVEDFWLLKQSEAGPVNIKQAAQAVADYQQRAGNYRSQSAEDRAAAVEKSLRRKLKPYKVKAAKSGRPRLAK